MKKRGQINVGEESNKVSNSDSQNSQDSQNQLLSNLFLANKKDRGDCHVINLKALSQFVHDAHFKMENLQILKYLLKERVYMCKINLKDTYFTIHLENTSCHLVNFLWEGNLCKFPCLCLGLRPVPQFLTSRDF